MTAEVMVVGAGVIGLSTAMCLAERGLRVEVRSELEPARTTSAVASAMVGPAVAPVGSREARWERASATHFSALAGRPGTGVEMRRGRLAARQEMPAPPGAVAPGDRPPGDGPCRADELPEGFVSGSWTTLPLVDMPRYLAWLADRLTAAAATVVIGRVASLRDLADEVELIVDCSGLGARELAGDATVTPVRGQHVIVENPGLDEFFIEAPFAPEWAAYWPYPDHVVLGGSRRPDDESTEPDRELSERIIARCVEVEPRLRGARVLDHQVGLRPVRPSPRLDVEAIGAARCVHSYGHGGSGVTYSWGAALEATALLLGGA